MNALDTLPPDARAALQSLLDAVAREVAAERRDLEAAARRAGHLRHLIEILPVPTAIFTPAGELLDANRAFRRLAPPGLVFSRLHEVLDVLLPSDREVFETAWEAVAEGTDELHLDLRHPSGGEAVLARLPSAEPGGTPVVALSLPAARRRVRRPRPRVARRSKGPQPEAPALAVEAREAAVAHDLRSPLRTLGGLASLMLDAPEVHLTPAGRVLVRRMERTIERMSVTLERLLLLDSAAVQALEWDDLDLSALARSVSAELRLREPRRNISIHVEPEMRALGDGGLARVVLQNLIENAWKYTAYRTEARIEVGHRDQGDERHFYVRDNGVGFDPRDTERLFRPHARLHDRTQFPGTGLGLFQVRRIAERHGGRAWAESEEGTGATFWFTLGAKCRRSAT